MKLRMRFYRAVAAAYLTFVEALDLGGSDGKISFQKEMLIAVLVCGTLWKLDTVLGVAIIAGSFGRTVFLAWVNRSSFTANYSRVDQRVLERRSADDGIEETR